jgi:hypothetical protein
MNTDKLLKAIQILVEEEVKRQLPKVLAEMKSRSSKKAIVEKIKSKHSAESVSAPSMAKAILGEDYNSLKSEVQYTKNPMINKILNETKNASAYPGATNGYDEWPTMNNPITNVTPANNVDSIRASMAQKMGYGDMVSSTGLGVDTGNEVLNKAFNRDYSELVRRFDKKL